MHMNVHFSDGSFAPVDRPFTQIFAVPVADAGIFGLDLRRDRENILRARRRNICGRSGISVARTLPKLNCEVKICI